VWGAGRGAASLKDLLGEEESKHYRSLAQWNKLHNWEEVERKTVGFSFLSGDQRLQTIEQARALGESEEGWAKYRESFHETWLKPYNLIDDLFDTVGYWGGPEPSFNLRVFGSIEDVERFADAWGAQFNQQSMAILNPKPGAPGGKFAWQFGKKLTDVQMNEFFGSLDQLNDLSDVKEKGLFFGVTTFDSKRMEFWFADNNEREGASWFLSDIIKKIGVGFSKAELSDYEFYFRSQANGDY